MDDTSLLNASIGWIDFSPSDRNRVGSILDLLKPEGMVDELGIGTIRDALANQLFPGISTIQTRAKYFFIIPYILYDYQHLTAAKRKNRTALNYLELSEYEVMWQLADAYNHEDGSGVIGITKRKPNKIARRPSTIYWNGLKYFDFISTGGLSASAFFSQVAQSNFSDLLSAWKDGDELQNDDAGAAFENIFRINVPRQPNWNNDLSLDLTQEEAEIFRDKIITVAKAKLSSELFQNEKLWPVFLNAPDYTTFAKTGLQQLQSDRLKQMIILAHDFSELMYGAHIFYNMMLQQQKFNNDHFLEEWNTWKDGLTKEMISFETFNPLELELLASTTKQTTKYFVKTWWQEAQSGFNDPDKLANLILLQETHAKGRKARLKWNKTEDIKDKTWTGLKRLDYRFPQAKTIFNDIKSSLDKNVTS